MSNITVKTEDIVRSAEAVLANIYRYRNKARREFCNNYVKNKWYLFRKPTRKDALKKYYNDGKIFSPYIKVAMNYAEQENRCLKLLCVAKFWNPPTITISLEDAYACKLKEKNV